MKIIRYRLKRFLIALFASAIIVFVVIYMKSDSNYVNCSLSSDELKKVEDLLDLIQKPLKDLKLSYFLCYNSLWGALKNNGPLPWHNNLELCVLNEQMSAIDELFLSRSFKRHGLTIEYISSGGFYEVYRLGESKPSATVTVFEEDVITHKMRRVGFIHRVLPPQACDELNCFPPELIATPLPSVKFGEYSVPAPRDGIEIQKYLFPHSWWKELTPSNCLSSEKSNLT